MIFWTLLACAAGMTLVQDIVPGRPLYHYGWYNVLAVAFVVLAVRGLRSMDAGARLAAAGAALIVIAGVAGGLTGPDTQTIAGAPGASIGTQDFGTLRFPLDAAAVPARRFGLSAIFSARPRAVVHVQVADVRGNHLTVTQPSGATFLSPVLLMEQTAHIAGMDVQTDEFAVPALNRNVKAVLFTASQVAQLRTPASHTGKPAVLFAVTDGKGHTLRNGLGLVVSGTRKRIGDMSIQADVETYPALEAASAPFGPLVLAGIVLLIAGAAGSLKSRSRSKT